MPDKTQAAVTVNIDEVVTVNLGFATNNLKGATQVRLPNHVAKFFADYKVVTVTTPGANI
jgi:hypothetical protein